MILGLISALALAAAQQVVPTPAIDYAAPITIPQAVIVAADTSMPRTSITITDPATGKRLTFEGVTTNTFTRNGMDLSTMVGQKVGFEGYHFAGAPCESACKVRLRALSFPGGTKIFYGQTPPPPA